MYIFTTLKHNLSDNKFIIYMWFSFFPPAVGYFNNLIILVAGRKWKTRDDAQTSQFEFTELPSIVLPSMYGTKFQDKKRQPYSVVIAQLKAFISSECWVLNVLSPPRATEYLAEHRPLYYSAEEILMRWSRDDGREGWRKPIKSRLEPAGAGGGRGCGAGRGARSAWLLVTRKTMR